ncbi:cell division protein FtsL [Nitrincola alkalilacustris]|uniref:cell division protein FtsL n=1 Tax=Nitrincola alkalilacustris TaxID=1571224 RepID=UPI001456C193|nr:cell division protein FtsL [Nitrincola alkalilacustris]
MRVIKRLFTGREEQKAERVAASRQTTDSTSELRMLTGADLFRPAMLLLILAVLLLVSALMVVQSAYDYRRLFNDHQVLVYQWDEMQIEWGQLLLEQSVWAGHNRIENKARQDLGMLIPEHKQIEIIRDERQN